MTMALDIPKAGLSLRPGDQSGAASAKPSQIMRLNLVQHTLDELIQDLRNDQPVRVRLGKHPALHYGGKSQSFHTYPETHRSEIYHSSPDKQTLYFTGVLSHSLEVEKAKEATASTDQALANLEESLNAFERGKESKKTHIISHPDELKALRGGRSSHRGPASKVELEKDRFLKSANRPLTSSPTLGAPKSPVPIPTPTSVPLPQNKDRIRLEALRTPFIHLLAVRAVSTKFLARQTRASVDDCHSLAQKYGIENRLNREKFDLKDKTYKDLDVWSFPYPTPEDRQEAIENAISAYDRMRISRTDKLWQSLLPKEERGKGKCLSRLNLSTGPIKKPLTPRIQAHGSEDPSKDDSTTSNETDRASGSSMKQKGSEAPAPRSNATTQKPRATDKDATKRSAKAKNTNSTLTGRVTKKAERKPAAKTDGKFKSAEFVHESDDEDDEMPDAAPAPAPANPPAKQAPAKSQAPAKARSTDTPPAPTPKVPKAEAPTPKLEPSQPSAKNATSKRPSSRPSTSPQKPSPLGSSPPTNASEVLGRNRSDSQNNSSSSSSSSPLISQLSRTNKAGAKAPRAAKPPVQTNGVSKPASTVNPLKRKAELDRLSVPQPSAGRSTGNLEHKRRRAVSTSSGGSTGSASPPMSHALLRQQLREKSQKFKQYYAKYRSLHDTLEAHADPPQADLDRLQRQHTRLQRMKKEIWDEDRRLQSGLLS
ncbi:hypothetical protein NUU61_002664 [Penicillium alfredii]|uniref:Uncharacterized protein n=1 Tax=Penicillium alfredii TaxID=1506179 RepID=A0A9W9KHG3_9EURO|nr:uncharacterized protein NUU61_002664 [Penicillium alfredii]KAJ5105317.1 hypothetical protein NUU61_002664 [Penicillium alfredii]